jgi:hypothetical protein
MEMPANEDQAAETTTKPTDEEAEEERSKAEAENDDEDEVEGHVSTPDLWLPSNNKWKRRR